MTPTRYRECLDALGLSQRALAPIVRCSDRWTRSWATGAEPIPDPIGEWLEACVLNRLAHPDPPVPHDWKQRKRETRDA